MGLLAVGEGLQLCVDLDSYRGSSCLLDVDGGLKRWRWIGLRVLLRLGLGKVGSVVLCGEIRISYVVFTQ